MTKKVKIEIELFSYDELTGSAKTKALTQHWEFMDSIEEEYEDSNGEMVKEFVNHKRIEVEESIRINKYLFFKDGKMAHCVTYTGKHEKAGTTEFKFMDVVYVLD